MITLALGVALGAPPGWDVTKEAFDGCELATRSEPDVVTVMRAECEWPDVDMRTFNRELSDWSNHDEIFSMVVESTVRGREEGRYLVYQKHRRSGINDREVLMWATHERLDGADRYAWTQADDRELVLEDGTVATKRHEGYWQAEPLPDGGIRLVHELRYDPGGSVPNFLVRWFQTGGLEQNLTELHQTLAPQSKG